jgi:hypothetical protein
MSFFVQDFRCVTVDPFSVVHVGTVLNVMKNEPAHFFSGRVPPRTFLQRVKMQLCFRWCTVQPVPAPFLLLYMARTRAVVHSLNADGFGAASIL